MTHRTPHAIAVALAALFGPTAAGSVEISLAPPADTRLAVGQRFDVRVSLSGAAVESPTWSVTLDGTSLATTQSSGPVWLRRGLELTRPGSHVLRAEARDASGATVALAERKLLAQEWGATRGRARNVILLIGDGMGLAHRAAARTVLYGVRNGRPGGFLAMERLPISGLLVTSSLDGVVTDSAAAAHAFATGTKTNNWMVGVFPDETADRDDDNATVEQLPYLLARLRGTPTGIVTDADVTDATPAAFLAHTASRSSRGAIARHYVDAARRGFLRVLLGGGNRNLSQSGDDIVAAFVEQSFVVTRTASELAQTMRGLPSRLLGIFHNSHMDSPFDTQKRGDPKVAAEFPDQPSLEAMTRAAIRVLSQSEHGFFLMVEGASIDKQAHWADAERMIWQVLAFDKAVAAALEFARTTNEDGNPRNDTLVIVTADHETGGVVLPGVGDPGKLGSRDYVRTYETGGLPDGGDANADGFPDVVDPAHKLVVHFGASPDRYEDWQSQPRPVPPALGRPGKEVHVYPNPERDGGRGVLLTGAIENSISTDGHAPTQPVHTAVDVPLSAYGPGAEALAGVHDNTELFFAVLRAVGDGSPDGTSAGTRSQGRKP